MPDNHWNTHCPWCGVHLSELTGRCHCGRVPIEKPNVGLTIEQGREALKRAADRKIELPLISDLD